MDAYTCHYAIGPFKQARAVYHAPGLATAMASHNAALPAYRDKVLKWTGPTGITYHMHDSKLTLDPESE